MPVRAQLACRVRNGLRSRRCRLRGLVLGRLLFTRCGCGVLIGKAPIVVGGHRISVGNRVSLADDVWLNVEPLAGASGSAITIGDGTGIGRGTVVSAALSVEIGPRVTIAPGVLISDHQHAFADPDRPVGEQGITEPVPVRIEEGSWIGTNAVVMPGVRIGRNAVIGANSVVTRSVPDGAVVGGVPARPLRSHVEEAA